MSISQNYPIINPSLSLDFANTKKLDPRITYARASTATYYDGKTVTKAEENLLLRSQEFDNGYWFKTATTATANATTAPDGTTTADSFLETTLTNRHTVEFTSAVQAGLYAISAFVKANGRTAASLYLGTTSQMGSAHFDLATGTHTFNKTIGSVTVVGTPVITNAGDGWYRISCVLSFPTALSPAYGGVAASDRVMDTGTFIFTSASYEGDITKGLYVWGAQLEARSTVTAYTPTTTQPITNYIPTLLTAPANVARFDNDPVTGESLGLEVEEQRTNLVLNSDSLTSPFAPVSATLITNVLVSPDGTINASQLTTTVIYNFHSNQYALTTVNGSTYSLSCYFKQGTSTYCFMSATGGNTVFNLSNGTVSAGTGSIVSVGNGWYRCSTVYVASSTTSYINFGISNSSNQISFSGTGFETIYLWGAQAETGAFPTSYIKTVASQVTRAADSASMTGTNFSSWYRQDQGSFYVEATMTYQPTGADYWLASDGTISNSLAVYNQSSGVGAWSRVNGVTQANFFSGLLASTLPAKTAYSYKINDFAISLNGSNVAVDTTGLIPFVNQFSFGNNNTAVGGPQRQQHIKKIAYYPQRLTNTQLQALTS